MQSSTNPSSVKGDYFVDQRKGEVNELKHLLKHINIEKDVVRKREIIKKVIAFMTLGIDVSKLLIEMVMAVETKDLVIKKMIYFFLCNYAHSQPDMAILCMNTLLRDCENENPMMRGLALRSLSSLRLPSIFEYIAKPLNAALRDPAGYVRKTAVMSILKLDSLVKNYAESNGYIEILLSILENDPDIAVVTNALIVLNELLFKSKGITHSDTYHLSNENTKTTIFTNYSVNYPSKKVVISLLNRLNDFNEWGINYVLDNVICKHFPSSEEEMFNIMNFLDPLFRTANSSIVLSTFKCFITLTLNTLESMKNKFTWDIKQLHHQIFSRVKPSLLTIVTSSNFEIQFIILKHIEHLLLSYSPSQCQFFMSSTQIINENNHNKSNNISALFEHDYKYFFIKYSEPFCIKYLKISIIPLVTNLFNYSNIITELMEYVTDIDIEISKMSINALGNIALNMYFYSDAYKPYVINDFRNEYDNNGNNNQIALNVVEHILQLLLAFLRDFCETDNVLVDNQMINENISNAYYTHIHSQSIINISKIIRKFPIFIDLMIPYVSYCLYAILNNESLSSISINTLNVNNNDEALVELLWIIGEYGNLISDAPYILEAITNKMVKPVVNQKFTTNNDYSNIFNLSLSVKITLLTSCVKLFFKRPPEMAACLGQLFYVLLVQDTDIYKKSNNSSIDIDRNLLQDLNDKALLYYRLMQSTLSLNALSGKMKNYEDKIIQMFSNHSLCHSNITPLLMMSTKNYKKDSSKDLVYRSLKIHEFNTLSVIFGMQSQLLNFDELTIGNLSTTINNLTSDKSIENSTLLSNTSNLYQNSVLDDSSTPAVPMSLMMSDIELFMHQNDDVTHNKTSSFKLTLFNPSINNSNNINNSVINNNTNKFIHISSNQFQSNWSSLPEKYNKNISFSKRVNDVSTTITNIVNECQAINLQVIASGKIPNIGIKLFFYVHGIYNNNNIIVKENLIDFGNISNYDNNNNITTQNIDVQIFGQLIICDSFLLEDSEVSLLLKSNNDSEIIEDFVTYFKNHFFQ